MHWATGLVLLLLLVTASFGGVALGRWAERERLLRQRVRQLSVGFAERDRVVAEARGHRKDGR